MTGTCSRTTGFPGLEEELLEHSSQDMPVSASASDDSMSSSLSLAVGNIGEWSALGDSEHWSYGEDRREGTSERVKGLGNWKT